MNAFLRFAARLFFGINSTYESANRSSRRAQVPGSAPRDATLDLTPGVRSELVRRSRYLARNSGFIRHGTAKRKPTSTAGAAMPN